jgi:hypothetical protein
VYAVYCMPYMLNASTGAAKCKRCESLIARLYAFERAWLIDSVPQVVILPVLQGDVEGIVEDLSGHLHRHLLPRVCDLILHNINCVKL